LRAGGTAQAIHTSKRRRAAWRSPTWRLVAASGEQRLYREYEPVIYQKAPTPSSPWARGVNLTLRSSLGASEIASGSGSFTQNVHRGLSYVDKGLQPSTGKVTNIDPRGSRRQCWLNQEMPAIETS